MDTVYGIYREGYVGAPVLLSPLYATEEIANKYVEAMITKDKRYNNEGKYAYEVKLLLVIDR